MVRTQGSQLVLLIVCAGLTVAGCASSSGAGRAAQGTANVAYASSLQFLNERVVSPAFSRAEGYQFSGRGASSGELSAGIAAREISPDVFESVGSDNITPLEPKFTKWYIPYAGTQMVLAYNPDSKYASQFRAYADGSKPVKGLFTLLQTKGLKLGRTDPNIDPQGRDFIYLLELAQMYYHLPKDTVSKILGTADHGTADSPQIYAESALDATLQSGQLDAASAFLTQAVQLHLDYIKLPAAINLGDAALADDYAKATVTIKPPGQPAATKSGSPQVIDITIIGRPTPAGTAFVRYTLSPAGLAQYRRAGFTLINPTVVGDSSAVPAAIRNELGG